MLKIIIISIISISIIIINSLYTISTASYH